MVALPLNALRAFALVVKVGGIRAAARQLDVSHSAVSRHVRELERWLQTPLLARGEAGEGLQLTPQARQLAATTLAAFKTIEEATDLVRERRSRHAVAISCAPSFATRWLLPRVPALQRKYPHIEVSIHVEQRVDDPGKAGCDLAIRMGRGPWPGVDAEPLLDDLLFPVMSPDAWARAGRPADPAGLLGVPILHDRDPSASWLLWRQTYGPASLDVRKGARFSSSDLVLRAAAQGLGVALARGRLVGGDLEAGTLLRPMGDRAIPLQSAYWLICSSTARATTAATTVRSWLKREARTAEHRVL